MKKRWNRTGKITVCSLMSAIVIAGMGFGMTADAGEIIDDGEILILQETVPESENRDALPAEAAGEPESETVQIMEITDEQVPGAAAPEMAGEDEPAAESGQTEAGEDEPAAESGQTEAGEDESAAESGQTEAGEDEPAAESRQTETQEESEKIFVGTLTCGNGEISVTVDVSEEAQLPAGTEVKVTKLEKGSEKYETAKEAVCRSLAADKIADCAFYDVTLESEGQPLSVKAGTVFIKMEFSTEGDGEKNIVRIEEKEGGKTARNVTDKTKAAGRTESVKMNY